MRVLITGHRGFIGRHFCDALDSDNEIDGVDIADSNHPQDLRTWVDIHRPARHYDLVIHCAAIVGGRANIDSDPLAVATNLAIDSDFFRWVARARPARVVYFSSSAVYPIHYQQATDALWPTRALHEGLVTARHIGPPDQSYGWAKLVGEQLARHVNDNLGIPVHVFRPFSGYGSDQALDYPFPAFIDRAIQHADPFTIWGNGRQVRDWIHVDDIVRAVATAIDHDIRGPVNLGNGLPVTFDELAARITEAAGYNPQLEHHTDEPSGVQYRVADPRAMLKFYQPRVTLHQGITRAIRDRTPPASNPYDPIAPHVVKPPARVDENKTGTIWARQ